VSVYFFRPVQAGICVECGKPYPKLTAYVHLTADGVKHPACDKDAPITIDMVVTAQRAAATLIAQNDDMFPILVPDPPPRPAKPKPAKPKPAPKKKPVAKKPPPKKTPPPKKEVKMQVLPRPETERAGAKVCRNCWTVHPSNAGCGK
jgi:hypothetical protein